MLQKDISTLQNFDEAIQHEWLETNGLGGWSGSSIIGCHTRRYHSLLVAATVPPAERMSLVSKLDETLIIDGRRFDLGTNHYGDVIHPQGFRHAVSFKKELFPEFTYDAGNVQLKKTIAMVHGENTVVVLYQVINAAAAFTMELLPLLSVRGYHSLMHANNAVNGQASFSNDIFAVNAYDNTPRIYIKVPGATYESNPQWFYNFNYSTEKYRGLDYTEDLFAHGKFSVTLREGDSLGIVISTEDPQYKNASELLSTEEKRKKDLLSGQQDNETIQQLVLAADQFIVNRGANLKTIIAGYHWFTDWGRDTMISLPGLTLSTGRYEDAKKILSAFAGSISMGMLPNRFQDNGEPPEYNNVDGTLWYFIAIFKYLEETNDQQFILQAILPSLKDIIDWHFKGTRYHIHADEDGLLFAGEAGQQLTWMDARIGTWVVTPRMGKPVEIQALWYNALKIFSKLLYLNNQPRDAAIVNSSAEKVKESFNQQFWYAEGNYLYDCIDEQGNPINELRPNQLFAISLPYPLIEGEKAKAVLQITEAQLYTPVGLRTLPESDIHYVPVYGGDAWHRDSSYHEGTVWSWLLGPYIDAIIKVDGTKDRAISTINNFTYHLNEACIGSVSEIFDAAEPHHPRGCVAQAWGVAEVLRVIKAYNLLDGIYDSPVGKKMYAPGEVVPQ
jgi:predicted glycogen debranching enzyme